MKKFIQELLINSNKAPNYALLSQKHNSSRTPKTETIQHKQGTKTLALMDITPAHKIR
jgi:hypothetical protein